MHALRPFRTLRGMSESPNSYPTQQDWDGPAPITPPTALPGPPQKKRDSRLFASGVLGVAWVLLPPLAGFYIFYDLANIAEFLSEDPNWGFWVYVVIFAVTAGLGFLPTYSQAFLGGWVFGMNLGLTGAIMGFTGGAAIGYIVVRMVTGRSVDGWIDRHPKGRVIRDALARGSTKRTFLIVTLLRLPPSSPFALTNYALSATRIPFWLVMAATPIGMFPRTAIVCLLASAARAGGATDIATVYNETPSWLFFTGIVLSVAVIAAIGQLANRALEQLTARGTS